MRHRAWLYKADILLLHPSGHVQSTSTCHMCPRIAMKASGYICRWQHHVAISKDWMDILVEPCLYSQHSWKSLTHSIFSSCLALQDCPVWFGSEEPLPSSLCSPFHEEMHAISKSFPLLWDLSTLLTPSLLLLSSKAITLHFPDDVLEFLKFHRDLWERNCHCKALVSG